MIRRDVLYLQVLRQWRVWRGLACVIESLLCKRIDHTHSVACGAASHLRLKQEIIYHIGREGEGRMWSGFSSEIETPPFSLSTPKHTKPPSEPPPLLNLNRPPPPPSHPPRPAP